MNKTVTINISGIIFHIDETAYDKLRNYLDTIRSYFGNSESRDEIIADIEARIAEIFSSKITPSRQVILMPDVDEMIAVMGNPEVFREEGAEDEKKSDGYRNDYKPGDTNNYGRRRIYRDSDDKVLGGICSGVAAYFNIDPIWLRLAFAISFFVFGTGFLFYILLWIVIPEAKTTAQKLEMRGEPVTVSNIEKNIREEVEELKKRFSDYSSEAKSTYQKNYSGGFSGVVQRTVDLFVNIVRYAALAFVKFIGIAAVIFSLIMLGVVLSVLIADVSAININNASFTFNDLAEKFFVSSDQMMLVKIGIVLTLVVPLLWIVYQGVRVLLKIKHNQRFINLGIALLWLIGVLLLINVSVNISSDFKSKGNVKQTIQLSASPQKTIVIKVVNTEEWDDEINIEDRWRFILDESKNMRFAHPNLSIDRTNGDSLELVMMKSSRGTNSKIASARAERIEYNIAENDSIIVFNPTYIVSAAEKYRGQKLKFNLKIPVGTVVYFHPSVRSLIYDIQNVSNTYDEDMINRRWKMTEIGLQCVDCEGITEKNKKQRKTITINVDEENEE
jgi:phage shock protein PspC (stress-responsive transcriptional regulator)